MLNKCLKKIAIASLLAVAFSYAYANTVTDAMAISAFQTAVAVTSSVAIKSAGLEPQYISTPNGLVVVPSNQSPDKNISSNNQYEVQNNQANKQAFFEGSF